MNASTHSGGIKPRRREVKLLICASRLFETFTSEEVGAPYTDSV